MSRPLRIQYPDAWYHVMDKGVMGLILSRSCPVAPGRRTGTWLADGTGVLSPVDSGMKKSLTYPPNPAPAGKVYGGLASSFK